jgi:outer membrane receptor protein involved in Fe transport
VFRLDASANFRALNGEFTLALRNVFDHFYIPPPLQGKNNARDFIAAPGQTATLSYTYDW